MWPEDLAEGPDNKEPDGRLGPGDLQAGETVTSPSSKRGSAGAGTGDLLGTSKQPIH